MLARGREAEGDDVIKRFIDADENNAHFIQIKDDIMTAIKLEREQTKRLTLKVLFTGDGSPTKNVTRIWLAFLSFRFPSRPAFLTHHEN